MHHLVPAVTALLACAAELAAQVPYGSSILGVISNTSPGEGLYLGDRAGNCVPVTGLLAAGSSNLNVNVCALDPIDDRVWIASSTTNEINWIRITGTTVSQFVQHGTLPVIAPASIVFDDNSNPIVCAGDGSTGGVFRIDRRLGGAGTLIGAVAGTGIHNAMAKDLAGNIYVGIYPLGQVYRLTKFPDGSYYSPWLFGTVPMTAIWGLTFAPADGFNPAELWITTFGVTASQMFRMPLLTGGVGAPVANGLSAGNWIDYDRGQNDLLVSMVSTLASIPTDRFMQVNRTTGLGTQLSLIQGGDAGSPAYNDANDAPFGVAVVAPRILNGGVGPFDLELGTTAPPGTLAVVGVAAPFVSILGVGLVGADGHLSVKLPNITLAGPIAPGSLTFRAAYFDASFHLVLGSPVPWPTL